MIFITTIFSKNIGMMQSCLSSILIFFSIKFAQIIYMKIFKSTKKQFQEIIKKIQIIVMNLITMSLEN